MDTLLRSWYTGVLNIDLSEITLTSTEIVGILEHSHGLSVQLSVWSKYLSMNLCFWAFAVPTSSHECSHHHQGACQGEFLAVVIWLVRVEHPNEVSVWVTVWA